MDQHNKPDFLYQVAWEVCNRAGGVHTVLETSAPYISHTFGDDVLYVGPDLWANRAAQEAFEEDPVQPLLAGLAAERDIPVRFGRWKVEGRPPAALVDYGRLLESKNRILGDLWNQFKVDSISADWDAVERILFGYAAGMLVELHYHASVRPRALRAVAHFHTWLTAPGLLRIAGSTPEVGTVYTAHGTALGRALAESGIKLHQELADIEPASAAKERGLEAQHTAEVAAARQASVLTAVSEHTADEAAHILGRRPDLITQNGFAPRRMADSKHRADVRAALFRCAERFLGSPLDPETRLVFTSGPYQFLNKGLDVTIKAAGQLLTEKPERPMLLLLAVSAPQTGPRHVVTRRLKDKELAGTPCGVCTHNLAHAAGDPILSACREAGLSNAPGDPVRVMFVPVMLDGRDPVLPFSYNDVLHASDLSVFPSQYEPWGYTPVESLAVGVPTLTTDLTGFGRFLLTLPESERTAVTVLQGAANGDLPDALADELRRFLARSEEELATLRTAGDTLVQRTSWENFIAKGLEAHAEALSRAGSRRVGAISPGISRLSRRSIVTLSTHSVSQPRLHRFTVTAAPPLRLKRLTELAMNPWWSWHGKARALFEALDGEAFHAAGGNPVRMLRSIDPERLAAAAQDDALLARFDDVLAEFDAYRNAPADNVPRTAYFCAEFAVHESLPIYSGGLGVLAGDHLKSSSDLRLPLVAVGLRYAHGYFIQRIQPDGRQAAEFEAFDTRDTPLKEVTDESGERLVITIRMPERELKAGVWRVDVGRVPLYLLDTLIPENDPFDQGVTQRLYPSDRESRLRQELLLGMGGWRVLRALGKVPEVCHLNEGHSAFLLLERLLDLVEEQGLTYDEAVGVVRASTVFTTHTPVPAGHDRFSEGLMRRYFGHVAERLGLDWEEFLDLGRSSREDREFSMTVLALRLSGQANGVSKLHGQISRDMLGDVWPGLHDSESPVQAVTNGVHLATWVGPEMDRLYRKHLDSDWADNGNWEAAHDLPGEELWAARTMQRRRMLEYMRESVEATGLRRGESPAALRQRIEGIRDDALWIGFARRFAPYKRATLLFRDAERLARLLDDEDRPVRIVFSGKAHPDDRDGGDLVREIVQLTTDERFAGRVFFVEDYGMGPARMLVQGVDIWLNTPTRPLEASGTSGMKACLNGGMHLSILDGWWCEGYDGTNGWAFGEGREYDNPEMQAEHDSASLYGLLESDIVPLFFDRGPDELPAGWLKRVRNTLATVPGVFTTHRMLRDYVRFGYRPLGEGARALIADDFAAAREKAARFQRLRDAWPELQIEHVQVTDMSNGSIGIGEVFEVNVRVHLGSLQPDEISAELYVGAADPAGDLLEPTVISLLRNDKETEDGTAVYTGAYLPQGAGVFRYGVRVLPSVPFADAAHLGLVRWA